MRSGEWERGKFDIDHYFAFLTQFLIRQNFLLNGILFGSSRGSFSKNKICPKQTSPSDFVKLGSEILYLCLKCLSLFAQSNQWCAGNFKFATTLQGKTLFIFGRKFVFCLFCFVCFVATLLQLCPILAYFFYKLKYSSSWEKWL